MTTTKLGNKKHRQRRKLEKKVADKYNEAKLKKGKKEKTACMMIEVLHQLPLH